MRIIVAFKHYLLVTVCHPALLYFIHTDEMKAAEFAQVNRLVP